MFIGNFSGFWNLNGWKLIQWYFQLWFVLFWDRKYHPQNFGYEKKKKYITTFSSLLVYDNSSHSTNLYIIETIRSNECYVYIIAHLSNKCISFDNYFSFLSICACSNFYIKKIKNKKKESYHQKITLMFLS